MRLVAIGQDAYWLSAVHRATTGWAGDPITVKCTGDIRQCISCLPQPAANAILLVDASGQGDMEQVVAALRNQGWRYVVVVAADPSAKEATAVLRRNLGYDYWEKTYVEEEIRERVRVCLAEITTQLPSLTRKSDSPME
jgi:thiaminase